MVLSQSIKAAESAQVMRRQSLNKIIVDSTVQEKAITHPADSRRRA